MATIKDDNGMTLAIDEMENQMGVKYVVLTIGSGNMKAFPLSVRLCNHDRKKLIRLLSKGITKPV